MHSLICRPKRTTDATVDRTMAAAAEKPFMMLSVYFTTTDVYIPPTLARTAGSKQREQPVKPLERHSIQYNGSCDVCLYGQDVCVLNEPYC